MGIIAFLKNRVLEVLKGRPKGRRCPLCGNWGPHQPEGMIRDDLIAPKRYGEPTGREYTEYFRCQNCGKIFEKIHYHREIPFP